MSEPPRSVGPRSEPGEARLLGWLPYLLIAGVVVAIYGPTLRHGFVYDDWRFIEANTRLDRVDPVAFLTDPTTVDPMGYEGIYRPLRTLSFAVDRALFGGGPAGTHAINALLHLACAWMVFRVARRLFARRGSALVGAILFAAHPAAVEAVAWASARDNSLFGLFFLVAFEIWLREDEGPVALTALGACAAIAMLAKETAVMLGPILLAHAVTCGSAGRSLGGAVRFAAGRWRAWLTVAAVTVVYLGLRSEVLRDAAFQRAFWWEGSAAMTRWTAVWAFALYAGRTVPSIVPAPFAFDWQVRLVRSSADPRFWLPAILLGAGGLFFVAAGRRFPLVAFAFAWFVLALLPTANLVVPVNILFADRFLYLAMILPLAGLGHLLARAFTRAPVIGGCLTLTALAGFAFVAERNVRAFADDRALWGAVLARGTEHPRPLRAYAFALEKTPETRPTRRDLLERALRLEPDYSPARRDLAELLLEAGDVAGAARQLAELVERIEAGGDRQSAAEYAWTCRTLLDLEVRLGRPDRAVAYGRRILDAFPRDAALRKRIGAASLAAGDPFSARAAYEAALEIDPTDAEAREALRSLAAGRAMEMDGRSPR